MIINLINDIIFINIIIYRIQDLNKTDNKFYNSNYLIFSIFFLFLFLILINILKENDQIIQIEPSLYNTIMF